jgi:hypothetical protein
VAVLVNNQGADWNQELYQATFERAIPDPSNPPDGLIAHFAAPREGGGWQVIEAWESEEAFRRAEKATPTTEDLGAPPFDSQVVEVHNSLVP